MIGEISVKDTAKTQHIPLECFQCFKGSKSSIQIADIPDLIGAWKITGISACVHYPDEHIETVVGKKVQGKYIVTLNECDTVGIVKNGFSILASAIDENGEQVQTFVLGVGDVKVLSHDSDVQPETNYWILKLLDETPESPRKGDVVCVDGKMQYWDGENWIWNSWLNPTTSIPDANIDGLIWEYGIYNGIETLNAYVENLSADVNISDDPFVTQSTLEETIEELDYSLTQKIPTKVSQLQNDSQFVNSSDLSNYATKQEVGVVQNDVGVIKGKIPSQASTSNQLADKNFVNSSITTATAFFRGTFNSTSQLPTSGITVNDYAFVIRTDAVGQTFYDRYKWDGSSWLFEYSINNSGFTASQFAAINSGITSQKVNDMMLSSDYNTVNLSGEYDDGTTFSYDFVVRN